MPAGERGERRRMRPWFVALVLAVFVTSASAQDITGDVTGRASPGARIEVRSVDGSTLVAATTAARDGRFHVSVPVGTYQLAGAGVATTIRIVAGHVSRVSNGKAIDETATLGLVLDANEIANLPLRRDASDVQRITPG